MEKLFSGPAIVHFFESYYKWYSISLLAISLFVLYQLVFTVSNSRRWLPLTVLFVLGFFALLPFFLLGQLNPDETFWMANIRNLSAQFNPWISADSTTTGTFALLPLYLLFKVFAYSYFNLRCIGFVMHFGVFLIIYRVIRHKYQSSWWSYLILAAFFILFHFSNAPDFIAYNTEHIAILVYAIALYALLKTGILPLQGFALATATRKYNWYIMLVGFCTGMAPWIKLQAVPVFFILFLLAAWQLLRNKLFKKALYFVLASLLPTLFMACVLAYHGSFHDFFMRYIQTNLDYADAGLMGFPTNLQQQSYWKILFNGLSKELLSNYIVFITFTVVIAALLVAKRATIKLGWLFIFLLIAAASAYQIIKPGLNLFTHYFLFAVQPFIFLFVMVQLQRTAKLLVWGLVLLQCGLTFFKMQNTSRYYPSLMAETVGFSNECKKTLVEIDKLVDSTGANKNSIVIWGWNNRYFVHSNYTSASRDFDVYHLIVHNGELGAYYRKCFFEDLTKSGKCIVAHDPVNVFLDILKVPFDKFFEDNKQYTGNLTMTYLRTYNGVKFYLVESRAAASSQK